MPEKLATDVYRQYGFMGLIVLLLGAIIIYIIWDRVQDVKEEAKRGKEIEDKKKSGSYVSFEDIGEAKADIKELKEAMKNHLADEAMEGERFSKIEGQLLALQEKVARENTHLFNQNSSLFEKIDRLDSKIDERFLVINQDIKQILTEMRK